METNFEKIINLGEIAFATNQKSSFAKPYDVNAPGPSRNSPKHVSFQSTKEYVGSNDMVHNYYLEEAKKKAQLLKDKALNTKPSVQQSTRLPNTANGNKPKHRKFNQQPRNWPPSMSSRVSNRTLSKANSRASSQTKDAQSHKTTKRYIPVEKKSESKNHGRQIPIGQRYSRNKSSNVYLKTTPLRYGLTGKPTGRIFNQVGLKWIPIKKPVETQYNTNDSASPLGKETHNPKTVICANSSLSAGVSNDVLAETGSIHNLSDFTKMNSDIEDDIMDPESFALSLRFGQNIRVILKVLTVKMEILLEPTSNKLLVDLRIKKAQDLKTKTSANSDIQDLPSRYQDYQDNDFQGRLLASFQDDAKYEHVGQDTRSRDGKDDKDKQGKDLKISDVKTKSKDNDKGLRSNIAKHEGTSLQQRQRRKIPRA
ncbi:hypothetical protein Tco_1363303 [Tanacetum coccineum]